MSSNLVGYLITGLWTLVNLAAIAAIVVFIIFLYKYLTKSNKTKKEEDA